MNRVAVIVNELGEIGVDNDLVETSSEQMMLLNNGCLCCTLRSDLQETLRELFVKRRNGEIIDFERVIVETTGIADPAPVMQTLMTDSMLLDQFRLDCVVTLVDAVNSPGQLDTFPEPVKQVALADRLVVTKTRPRRRPGRSTALERRLREINPRAPHEPRVERRGRSRVPDRRRAHRTRSRAWRRSSAGWAPRTEHDEHGMTSTAHRHDEAITTFTLRFDKPLTWQAFTQMHGGPDRAARPGPPAREGARQRRRQERARWWCRACSISSIPPIELAAWPSADRGTRLVFITRGIHAADRRESLFRDRGDRCGRRSHAALSRSPVLHLPPSRWPGPVGTVGRLDPTLRTY